MFGKIFESVRQIVGSFQSSLSKFVMPPLPEIENEERIQALYFQGIRDKIRNKPITEIVVHGTAGGDGTAKQFVSWQLGGELKSSYNQGIGLVHYVVGLDGKIIRTIDEKYWTYHSTSLYHDMETVGIELCNTSFGNTNRYTEMQYESLAALCDFIMRKNKQCRLIVGHNRNGVMYSGVSKNCPGSVFDWPKFVDCLNARKWVAKRIEREAVSNA